MKSIQKMPEGTYPDPYVKTYLIPDLQRLTKRKTKVQHKTVNPTYNEMVSFYLFHAINTRT